MERPARRRDAARGTGAPPRVRWRDRVDVRRLLLRLAALAVALAAIALVARVAILVHGDGEAKARRAEGVVDRATGVARPEAPR